MITSPYNVFVRDYPKEGCALIYNTLTQALLCVSLDIARDIEQGKITHLPKDVFKVLFDNGILARSFKEQANIVEKIFKDIRENMAKFGAEFTVLTTYDCNFRCVYCFEEDVISPVYMDKALSQKVSHWIFERAKERGYKWISLVFYGGEPLLNRMAIDEILSFFSNTEIKVTTVILTNGSLLRREDVVNWQKMGLKEVRVTLDGPDYIHNKRRFFKGGLPSFDKIIKNLLEIKDLVKISVAVNYDEETIGYVSELLDFLDEVNLKDSISSMVISPVMPRLVRNKGIVGVDLNNCGLLFSENGLFERGYELNLLARQKGFPVRFPLSRHLCPMVSKDGGFTIDPYGKIFRCNSLVGFDEFCVGDVLTGLNDRFYEFLNIEVWRKCPLDCPYLPMCFGGCRFFAFVESKRLDVPCCKKEFFDRSLCELIKLEYGHRRGLC